MFRDVSVAFLVEWYVENYYKIVLTSSVPLFPEEVITRILLYSGTTHVLKGNEYTSRALVGVGVGRRR